MTDYKEILNYWGKQKPIRNGKAVWLAIADAITKQIPTKAILKGNIFHCPRCNFAIGDIKEKSHRFCPKYCSNCGQNTGGLKYFDDNH